MSWPLGFFLQHISLLSRRKGTKEKVGAGFLRMFHCTVAASFPTCFWSILYWLTKNHCFLVFQDVIVFRPTRQDFNFFIPHEPGSVQPCSSRVPPLLKQSITWKGFVLHYGLHCTANAGFTAFSLLLLLWGLNHSVLSCNEHRKFSCLALSLEENA